MNVLILSSRFPWPPHSGDRLRATLWIAALERRATIALVSPPGQLPRDIDVRFHAAAPSARNALAALPRVVGGTPFHALLAAPYDWRRAIERARAEVGEFDAAVVLLTRLDPWVRRFLPRFRILDAVDAMERSMRERARAASPLRRWFWQVEARRAERWDRRAASAYDRVVMIDAEESTALGAVAVSNGVTIAPLDDAPRPFDFGFWGRLAYFANADAVDWLLRDIWPRIRAERPAATLLIAGADATPSLRAAHGRDGIVVMSPADDIAGAARQVRVALFPLRYGTGQSNKVLEAAEAGCAIVATSVAMRGLAPLVPPSQLAESAGDLARAALAAADAGTASRMSAAARRVAESTYGRTASLERLAAILAPAGAAA